MEISKYRWEELKCRLIFWIIMPKSVLRTCNRKCYLLFRAKVLLMKMDREDRKTKDKIVFPQIKQMFYLKK